MTTDILDQLSQASKKALFLYNIQAGKFDFLSQAVETIWAEKREAIIKSPAQLLSSIHPDDTAAVLMRFEQIRSGNTCEIEFSLQVSAGTVKQIKVDAYPILDAAGNVTAVAGEAEDVTAQAQYREYLLEFGQKKNSMLMVVVHDLQGPLAIIQSVASLLETDHANRDYEDINQYADIIKRAYDDCNKLIRDLLVDEHVKSVSVAVNRERFDAVEKVKQTVEIYEKSKVIKTAIEVSSPAEKIMVELDEIKFTQIMNNLITNSIKFTPPEGKITITIEQQNANLLITHTDTGIGIPKDLQPHLFEKYNKTARIGLNGEKPNGIGLSIIRDLVELQGGRLWFESEESQGTTFYLSFPLLP